MTTYAGMQVVVSDLAYRETRRARVEPTATRKRRRGWRVVVDVTREPQCWVLGGSTVVVAPEIYERLRKALP